MACRRPRLHCVLALLTLAWSTLETAKGVDLQSDCVCVPVVYARTAPAAPAKQTPSKPKFAQPTLAPPSAEPAPVAAPKVVQEKKPEPKPAVAESAKPEVPVVQHGPAVREEGPFYDTFSIALKKDELKPANDQCSATFTNLSDRPIKVIVENQERSLFKGASVTLPVARQFIWRMEGREPQNEQVAAGDYGLLIVIRR